MAVSTSQACLSAPRDGLVRVHASFAGKAQAPLRAHSAKHDMSGVLMEFPTSVPHRPICTVTSGPEIPEMMYWARTTVKGEAHVYRWRHTRDDSGDCSHRLFGAEGVKASHANPKTAKFWHQRRALRAVRRTQPTESSRVGRTLVSAICWPTRGNSPACPSLL